MQHIAAFIITASCIAGCVSSNRVTGAHNYPEINAEGMIHRAIIDIQGGAGTVECMGDYVTVGRDSVTWLDPSTQAMKSAATNTLRRLRFINRTAGAMVGIGFGIVPGIALMVLGIVVSQNRDTGPAGGDGSASAVTPGLILCGGGGLIGGGIGSLIGHRTEYVFPAP